MEVDEVASQEPAAVASETVVAEAKAEETKAEETKAEEAKAVEAKSERLSEKLLSMRFAAFKKHLEDTPRKYATLSKYRKVFAAVDPETSTPANRKKLRLVEKQMDAIIAAGLTTKRRRPGTGTRVVEKLVYQDTPGNRRLNRVGQEYERVIYQDAVWDDLQRSQKRRRRRAARGTDGAPRRNLWIDAVQQAKAELGAPKFVIVRKEAKDAEDEAQKVGVAVYNRAVEIMAASKAASEAAPVTAEE